MKTKMTTNLFWMYNSVMQTGNLFNGIIRSKDSGVCGAYSRIECSNEFHRKH